MTDWRNELNIFYYYEGENNRELDFATSAHLILCVLMSSLSLLVQSQSRGFFIVLWFEVCLKFQKFYSEKLNKRKRVRGRKISHDKNKTRTSTPSLCMSLVNMFGGMLNSILFESKFRRMTEEKETNKRSSEMKMDWGDLIVLYC